VTQAGPLHEPADGAAEGRDAAEPATAAEPSVGTTEEPEGNEHPGEEPSEAGETAPASDDDPRNRRRGRRGGRRRRRESDGELSPFAVPGADQPELQPVYAGPTPADPFGGRAFDIFDVMDQAERAAEAKPAARASATGEIVNHAAPEPEASNRGPAPVSSEPAPSETISSESASSEPAPSEPAPSEPVSLAPDPSASGPAPSAPLSAEIEEPLAPEPGVPETVQPEPEILNTAAPEPAGEVLGAQLEQAAGSLPTPANDTTAEDGTRPPSSAEPLIKPILVGASGEPPAEPKRGWWRR
jgi:ribonuclease E